MLIDNVSRLSNGPDVRPEGVDTGDFVNRVSQAVDRTAEYFSAARTKKVTGGSSWNRT